MRYTICFEPVSKQYAVIDQLQTMSAVEYYPAFETARARASQKNEEWKKNKPIQREFVAAHEYSREKSDDPDHVG